MPAGHPLVCVLTHAISPLASPLQLEKVRESIQTMVRSVHPLGRAMDQLQEDLEAMQREFTFWQHVRAFAFPGRPAALPVPA